MLGVRLLYKAADIFTYRLSGSSDHVVSFGKSFPMFLWSNDLIWSVVAKHGVDDVADLMHDGTYCNIFLFGLAFKGVVLINHRIYRSLSALFYYQIVYRNHMENTPCKV